MEAIDVLFVLHVHHSSRRRRIRHLLPLPLSLSRFRFRFLSSSFFFCSWNSFLEALGFWLLASWIGNGKILIWLSSIYRRWGLGERNVKAQRQSQPKNRFILFFYSFFLLPYYLLSLLLLLLYFGLIYKLYVSQKKKIYIYI